MKKILLLGGSAQQVIAITTAKKLGYYTIVCDYLEDNPGQYEADKFYLASTTDKEKILEIAKLEKIDGVIAYASDPAAPTAAYVAEKLNLLGNSYDSVHTLCNKSLFRKFLKENGFNSPDSKSFKTIPPEKEIINSFSLPVIVKPVDSSGSKGVTVLHNWNDLIRAIEFAFSFSRNHEVIIESFIEKKHPYLIGGDIFVSKGKVILWGLMNCHRDKEVNDLVPTGKSFPVQIPNEDMDKIRMTLQSIVNDLKFQTGAINVEMIVDKSGEVWPIDMGPRCGGNMIPDLLGYIFDIDIVKMAIESVMGDVSFDEIKKRKKYFASYNLHSSKAGQFKDIYFNEILDKYILKSFIYKHKGDSVSIFNNASDVLGVILLKFNNQDEMDSILLNMDKYIAVNLN